MAIFRKARRQRVPAASQATPPAADPRPASAGDALRDALRTIASNSTVPEEALEPALRAILDTSRAHAAAVCVFDPRHAMLRLVAEVGLSDEGCHRLRSVRRGDPTAWDMPLHGLLNRRAYLIESAARNRYVPRLVENASAVRSIACLPLYAGPTPIGSLVLVALAPRSFGERDIRLLERGAGELATMIEAVRRRGGVADVPPEPAIRLSQPGFDVAELLAERDRLRGEVAARLAERAVLAAEVTARTGEAERLRAALDAAAAERARIASDLERAHRDAERIAALAAALEAADRDRERLAAALEAAAAVARASSARRTVSSAWRSVSSLAGARPLAASRSSRRRCSRSVAARSSCARRSRS